MFVSIEGNDGSGKTTVVQKLYEKLIDRGIKVVATREPGGIDIAEKIRDLVLDCANTTMAYRTESLLYAASRAQHVEEKIIPALESGNIVICDRFVDSSLAYQGYARGLGIDEVFDINMFATKNLLPDLTIFLEIDDETARKRVKNRKSLDRLEYEEDSFHQKVSEGYQLVCERFANRIHKVDASRSIDAVVEDVFNLVMRYYV